LLQLLKIFTKWENRTRFLLTLSRQLSYLTQTFLPMKNRYLPFLSLCIGLLAGAVSCKDDATDDPAAAAIEITTQPIAAPAAGGTLQIAYRIVPAAGGGNCHGLVR
jgi:hypothetical protein